MNDRQTEAFARHEADRYYERNRERTFDPGSDPLCRLLELSDIRPSAIAEVGAGRGDRLAALAQRYRCRAVAVEPSRAAADEGRAAHPGLEFHVGTMDAVPVNESFDLVLVHFVFHWVGRADLLRSVAEIDRLITDGGHLGIGDFLPAGMVKTPYHHRKGLWTYKQDYSSVFIGSGLYWPFASIAGHYLGRAPSGDAAPRDRVAYTLLRKSLADHYLQVDSPMTSTLKEETRPSP